MPCYDGINNIQIPKLKSDKNTYELKDAFCSACRALEEAGIEIPSAAKRAWAKHKKEDDKRLKQEVEKQYQALRKSGLSKLTKAEKDALGLR